MFFRFPPDARWNPERSVVEFGIGVGEYEGVVRVPRRVFQILLPEAPTPERCLEAYHLHRTRLELIAERKVRRQQLTDDGIDRHQDLMPWRSRFGYFLGKAPHSRELPMPSWGIVAAVVAFGVALGTFLDKFFIKNRDKDKLRLNLISLYLWIDRNSIYNALLRIARALSGPIAMWVFVLISFVLICVSMWNIYQNISPKDFKEFSKLGLI